MLLATTGSGHAVQLSLKESLGQAKISSSQAVAFPCQFAGPSPLTNTGGTDVTPGPDGTYYRWCSRDQGMQFTGTRFNTIKDQQNVPVGLARGEFVSHRVDAQGRLAAFPFANAGSFCTNTVRWGCACWEGEGCEASSRA